MRLSAISRLTGAECHAGHRSEGQPLHNELGEARHFAQREVGGSEAAPRIAATPRVSRFRRVGLIGVKTADLVKARKYTVAGHRVEFHMHGFSATSCRSKAGRGHREFRSPPETRISRVDGDLGFIEAFKVPSRRPSVVFSEGCRRPHLPRVYRRLGDL